MEYTRGTKLLYRPQQLEAKSVEVELADDLRPHHRYAAIRFPSGQVRSVSTWRLKPVDAAGAEEKGSAARDTPPSENPT